LQSFHGTSGKFIQNLVNGKITNDKGSGELGKGFYSGEHLFAAKQWAFNKHLKSTSVLKLETPDMEVENLNLLILDYAKASEKRREIKNINSTQTFVFKVDMVWAPIVGTSKKVGEQYKWESQVSMDILNGAKTKRSTI
jgi:hypothetical protein